ncbi:NAD(P)/FAD-dependent oxidoreductase [Streptomyces sp. NBC_00872]|uniref:NAD(P)/FAD-dependent oxidoreductase n=1 Tax=Streptomyces sp. NBC_00872 TaxID=2903686 RepID=UPI00386467C1|nr:NAD(P)/FAD-dependent oxidoreductase [Streptomyces sp. NBC_00872]
MKRVVVVGASAGGLATAEALRGLGYGGGITLIGSESCLPYDRPPLSKQILAGELEPNQILLRRPEDLDALDLDLRLGETAEAADTIARKVVVGGGLIEYDALVVATGARPRRLPGSEGVRGVHHLRTLEDALALKAHLAPGRRLIVVGAGFIGAEAASTARGLGVEVTMIEPGPVPLAGALGPLVGRMLADVHRDHGVALRTGTAVDSVLSGGGRATGVRLADGTEVNGDAVVVGIGARPNTEWLRGSGLPLSDGLVCDEYCRAAPSVYGVGDVARWHNALFGGLMRVEHRTNAAEAGLAVARNLLRPAEPRPFTPVPYFWSDQYDLKIQAYGHLRGHEEVAIVDGGLDRRRFIAAYRKEDRLVGVVAVNSRPKELRTWRAAIADRRPWSTLAGDALAPV